MRSGEDNHRRMQETPRIALAHRDVSCKED